MDNNTITTTKNAKADLIGAILFNLIIVSALVSLGYVASLIVQGM